MRRTYSLHLLWAILVAACLIKAMPAQVVQPVIAEYTKTADGSFQVKNEGTAPQIVTLEPKSFWLNEDGSGIFRPLDRGIHLELSATSVRLEPGDTARIFYRVNAEALPAWLCIYANFSPAKEGSGVNVRIMLPHTIYLYSKSDLQKADVVVTDVSFDRAHHRVTASVQNHGLAAGRVTQMQVNAGREAEVVGGFPLLPASRRNVSIEWKEDRVPEDLRLRFAGFELKVPVSLPVGRSE